MTSSEFKNLVNSYGGEGAVIHIGLDNSAGITFHVGEFSFSSNLDENNNILKFAGIDCNGTPYQVLKPLETIQSILVKDPSVDSIDKYDRVSLRG